MRSAFSKTALVALSAVAAVITATFAVRAAPAAAGAAAPARAQSPAPDTILLWDATEKTITPEPGDGAADFQFTAVNVSDKPVTIYQLRPTCGCTVAEMPSSPWILAPSQSGSFAGTIDFRGKEGTVTKSIFVNSSVGTQRLTLVVKIPTLDAAARRQAQMIAQKNRQAVFAGDCAKCHVEPAKGKSGAALFAAACGVCHFSENRASFVPSLMVARTPRDAAFWHHWIADGAEGTLMPAWSQAKGGPLTDEQIDGLVKYALETFPITPPPKS